MQAVGNVGFKSKRGRHTTRAAILLDMPDGGVLVDTPGFDYPNLAQVTSDSLDALFPEVQELLRGGTCKFADCTHIHEPGCRVRERFERFEMYVRCVPARA